MSSDSKGWALPVIALLIGSGGLSGYFLVFKNHAPAADLRFEPKEVRVSEEILADASGSTDKDGDQLYYEWFVDGVRFEEEGAGLVLEFSEAGSHFVRVVVSDGKKSHERQVKIDVIAPREQPTKNRPDSAPSPSQSGAPVVPEPVAEESHSDGRLNGTAVSEPEEPPAPKDVGDRFALVAERLEVLEDCDSGVGKGLFSYEIFANGTQISKVDQSTPIELDSGDSFSIVNTIYQSSNLPIEIEAVVNAADDDGDDRRSLGRRSLVLNEEDFVDGVRRNLEYMVDEGCHVEIWFQLQKADKPR